MLIKYLRIVHMLVMIRYQIVYLHNAYILIWIWNCGGVVEQGAGSGGVADFIARALSQNF